jgi:hypothetical protein
MSVWIKGVMLRTVVAVIASAPRSRVASSWVILWDCPGFAVKDLGAGTTEVVHCTEVSWVVWALWVSFTSWGSTSGMAAPAKALSAHLNVGCPTDIDSTIIIRANLI